MTGFEHLILHSCDDPMNYSYVLADLLSGCLEINGYEWGEKLTEYAGIEGWEFHMDFSESETAKLFAVLGDFNDPEGSLKKYFGGEQCEQRLRDFCDKNGIEYSYWRMNS